MVVATVVAIVAPFVAIVATGVAKAPVGDVVVAIESLTEGGVSTMAFEGELAGSAGVVWVVV